MRTCKLLLVAAFSLVLAILGGVEAQFKGDKVLVVLERNAQQKEHKLFLTSLKEKGLELKVAFSSDSKVKLKEFGVYNYDHLVLLAPKVREISQSFKVKDVLEFVDAGGNVVLVADTGFSEQVGELARECGVDLDVAKSSVYDHINFAQVEEGSEGSKPDHTLVAADISKTSKFWGNVEDLVEPILFKGVAATIPPDSEYAVPGLLAPSTAYSLGKGEKLNELAEPIIGQDISLVTLVQVKNNARVVVFGSLEMLSDKFFQGRFKVWGTGKTHLKPGNQDFSLMAALWAFQHRGVLSVDESDIRHWEVASQKSMEMYRINDDIHFEVSVFEERDGEKVPFKDGNNAQLEYVMLDPYVRMDLQQSQNGTWTADFKAPDVYGVFKFVLEYRRPGYSYIDIVQQAPLRPYKHNEFDRFLVSAYPYYVSCISMMIGFFMLGWLFLYQK